MSHDDTTSRPAQPATQPLAQPTPPVDPASTPTGPGTARRGPRRTWWIAGGAVAGLVLLGGGVGIGALIADGDEDDDVVVVQRSDDAPRAASGADAGTGTGTVRVDQDDIELTGTVLESASTAALTAADGEGVVTGAERSDDPTHTYEVEVTRTDGTQMDVFLDDAFGLVATETWHRD